MLLFTVVTNGSFLLVFFLRFFPLLVGSRIIDTASIPTAYGTFLVFWWKLSRNQTFFLSNVVCVSVIRLCSYVRSWPAWPGSDGQLLARDFTWSSPTLMLRWVWVRIMGNCHEILAGQLDCTDRTVPYVILKGIVLTSKELPLRTLKHRTNSWKIKWWNFRMKLVENNERSVMYV